MNPQRIFGIVLVVIGIVLIIVGVNSSNSVADQVSETFTGRFTDKTTWFIIGGIAAVLFGGLMGTVGGRFFKK